MSQYLVLIYDDEAWLTDEAVHEPLMEGHSKFAANEGERIAGGAALQSVTTATTLRNDGAGEFAVTDGPFIESKEVVGGYYLIEATDLDDAIRAARQIPVHSATGGLEIRPLVVFPDREM
ncbi:MAG: YciI family protein [Jatrophihabitans sp.]|uniref:YciI family protein n=1 Tax=Jatrophihabitans sp. TaxID=1932789 RepID=UPI003F7DD06B